MRAKRSRPLEWCKFGASAGDISSGRARRQYGRRGWRRKGVFVGVVGGGFNDTAALIWDAMAQGGAAHAAVSQLLELGVHAAEAQEFVEQAASEWLRSGHIAPSEALSGEPRETFACMLSVGRVSIRLRGGLESGRFRAALRGFQGDSADEIAGFDLVERDVVIIFFRNGAPCGARSSEEAMPQLKAMLVDEYANHVGDGFLAHGALLSQGDDLIFLSGKPGAGKTTLALALAEAGFLYCSDDLVHIDAKGHALGLSFPAAVKPGAWKLLSAIPDVADAPLHRRWDGVHVRYVLPERLGPPAPRPITLFVRLQRTNHGRAQCNPISGLAALCTLLESGWSEQHRTRASLMRALADEFSRARHYDLRYSNLNDGVAQLQDLLS